MNVYAIPGLAILGGQRRSARWHAILERYAALSLPGDAPAVNCEKQCVVVGDSLLLDVVASCSGPRQTPARYAHSIEEALDHARTAAGRPVLFVVPRQLLTVTGISALTHGVRGPWGVITGRDRSAIAFALLKQQVVRRLAPGSALLADFVADVMGFATPESGDLHDTCAPSALTAENVLRPLTHQTSSFLVLHCHGDGAHGNLGSVVLCGLCDDEEHLANGKLGCCRRTGEEFICKRNPDRTRQPIRCGDLAATTVCLLTCNGSSVAGQGYPSDCSFVLSFVEGFPAAVITTDCRLPFTSRDVAGAMALLDSGRPLGEIVQVLNDEYAETSGMRPFVLFGDPTIVPARPKLELDERAAVEPASPARVQPQQTKAACTMQEPCRAVGRIVSTLAQRIRLQDAIFSTCAVIGTPSDDSLDAALDGHARLLRATRAHLGLGQELSAAPRRVATADLATWYRTLAALIDATDRSLITLVHRHVPQRDLHLLFTTGLTATHKPSDRICAGCGARLTVECHTSPLVAPGCTITTTCVHCGPESAWDGDGALIAATVPRVACAGSTLTVSIENCRTALLPTDYAVAPLASVRFRDVGKSIDTDIEGCGVGPVPRIVELSLRADTTLENNTVRVAAVHELSLGFQRAAVVVLPP